MPDAELLCTTALPPRQNPAGGGNTLSTFCGSGRYHVGNSEPYCVRWLSTHSRETTESDSFTEESGIYQLIYGGEPVKLTAGSLREAECLHTMLRISLVLP